MATGKTTLGRALAEAVPGLDFVDLDNEVEVEAGCSVGGIFARGGESAFRELESQVLRKVSRPGVVVACGGGTPCRTANMDFMLACGIVVCLEAGADTIVRRLLEAPAGQRPLVDACRGSRETLTAKVRAMLDERAPHYARATCAFDANRLDTAEQIAESVSAFTALMQQQKVTDYGSPHTS